MISKTWNLLPEEADTGYTTWKPNQNWQHGLMYRAMCYCKEFRVAIDVGAAYGATTIQLAKNFEEVYAIEMLPDLIPFLKKNTEKFDNIYYHNVAVGKKYSKHTFNYYPKYSGRSPKNSQRGNKYWQSLTAEDEIKLELEVKPLKFLKETPTWRNGANPTVIDLIKFDIEGSELYAIQGGASLIRTHSPVICIEVAPSSKSVIGSEFPKNGYFFEQVSKSLSSLGYAIVEKWRGDSIWVPLDRLNGRLNHALKERREFFSEW